MAKIAKNAIHQFLTGEVVDADSSPTGANLNPLFEVIRVAINDTDARVDQANTRMDSADQNLTNSYYTKTASDDRYYNKTEIDTNLYTKTQSDNRYYTKTELDASHYTRTQSDGRYYTQAQVDTRLNNAAQNLTDNYYSKTASDGRYYTKTEIDSSRYTKAESDNLYYNKTQIDTNHYTRTQADARYYTQAQVNDRNYSKTESDGRYYTKSEVNTNHYTKSEVDGIASGKVDKVAGKGLSTEDYTADDKLKLDGIEEGAEVNKNAFAQINSLSAETIQDMLTVAAGTGIIIVDDPDQRRITISATGEALPGAHASSHITGGADVIPNAVADGNSGLMSGADKAALDAVTSRVEVVNNRVNILGNERQILSYDTFASIGLSSSSFSGLTTEKEFIKLIYSKLPAGAELKTNISSINNPIANIDRFLPYLTADSVRIINGTFTFFKAYDGEATVRFMQSSLDADVFPQETANESFGTYRAGMDMWSGWLNIWEELIDHMDADIAHGMTSTSEPYRAPLRDANGNFSVGDATANGHVLNRRTADGRYASKDELNAVKQSVSDGKTIVAAAITDKGVPTTGSDTFQTMATNISQIETDPSGDATAVAADLLAGKTAYSQNQKITGTMTDYSGIAMPAGNASHIDAVQDFAYSGSNPYGAVLFRLNGTGKVTPQTTYRINVFGMHPDVVKAGQMIGTTGRSVNGTFTSDANALAADILSGKSGYVNGNKINGTMVNRGAVTNTITTQGGSYTIPVGYHNGSGKVTANVDAKRYATGVTAKSNGRLIVSGLAFRPRVICGHRTDPDTTDRYGGFVYVFPAEIQQYNGGSSRYYGITGSNVNGTTVGYLDAAAATAQTSNGFNITPPGALAGGQFRWYAFE